MEKQYDFCGWVTRNDLRCSDGRTIRKGAFKHCDGLVVPMVWNHQHDDPSDVLGHMLLEDRDEGVYGYGYFNDTPEGQGVKARVLHGDINKMSIWANNLKQKKNIDGTDVLHGIIREVSLVLSGANPGAYIESVVVHSEDGTPIKLEDEGILHTGLEFESIVHSEEKSERENKTMEENKKTETANESGNDKTIQEIYEEMTEEQKTVVHYLVGQAVEDATKNDNVKHNDFEGGNEEMKHNVFEGTQTNEDVISHADMELIIKDAKRCGSMKEAFIAHAEATGVEIADKTQAYGINGTDWLFPEARLMNTPPEFIQRDMGWVKKVMAGVHHTPFSRIKSMFADITEADARAKGYIKGKMKKEEVFGLLKRTTNPTTVYKKQKMDRDDIVDITDFDVIAWLKAEMRMMLDEEIARAILVGDGRGNESDDKISELNIRPIWTDDDLFTIKAPVAVKAGATDDEKCKAFIRAAVKSRKNYKGSGEPTLYTTEDVLTDCLLVEDGMGRPLYDTVEKLKNALRVKEIVTVPVMEALTRDEGAKTLMGIIVNLKDYNVGADKGGAVNMFDDFDIDYNQQKYLIETRCSGALIKPYSAIALELETAAG